MAGFFKRLWNKLRGKKDTTAEEIKKINEENRILKKEDNQEKFDIGLKKTSSALETGINELVKKYKKIDEELYESLEELLISYDIGSTATDKILEAIKEEVIYQNVTNPELIKEIFLDKMFIYYINNSIIDTDINLRQDRTNVVLIVGVNGVGKTTSIAKLANKFIKENKKVLLVAADTFRAGAVEQLKVWADRLGVDIVLPQQPNQEPASVIYQGVQRGYEQKYDLIICDTSGRLQNKTNLMNELKKIYQIIGKWDSEAPHETLLVLDATTGQSGLNQAKAFSEVSKITGIILTKMDSTSKGGIIFAIKDMFNIPVKFIGLGESLDDLEIFDLQTFMSGMLKSFDDAIIDNE